MELTSKGLLCLGALVATAVPSTAFAANNSVSFKTPQPWPRSLSGIRVPGNESKYSYYFAKLFVDNNATNKDWWNKAFARLSWDKWVNKRIGSGFSMVASAFDGADVPLSVRCSQYYNNTFEEINHHSEPNKVGPALEDFWKYCTVLEKGIELITINTKDSNTIKEKHQNILIAADGDKNSKFWNIQNEDFFSETGLGKLSKPNTSFHTLYHNKNESPTKTLRETCLASYDKEATGDELKDTLLFCSISPKITS